MNFRMRSACDFLSEAELEKVFQAAVRIWKRVPFRIQGTVEFMDALSAFGCRIDGERVRFPQAVIDDVLGRIREVKERNLAAPKPQTESWPGSEVTAYTHGQALLACDVETNRLRPATKDDLVTWCHVVDALGDVSRSHPTFIPTDVPTAAADFNAYATIILNSREPHRVSLYNAKMLPYFIEASVIAQGSLDAVKRSTVFATKMWVNSPFMITLENVEIAMDARRLLGQPIQPATMPTAAAAAPVTVAGALAQNTAESLALNAITLAVDGRLVGISAGTTVIDMASLSPRTFGPDVIFHRYAIAQMGAYLFGGSAPAMPAIGGGAQVVGPHSMMEKGIEYMLSIAAGRRSLGIGCLAASDVGSLVQLMLDYEMVGFFRHMLRDVKVDDEHIGEQTIIDTAPRGAYFMETEHTSKFFRESLWLPECFDYRMANAWQQKPSDTIDAARKRARDMMAAAANQCPLADEQRVEIQRLVDAANRDAAGTTTR